MIATKRNMLTYCFFLLAATSAWAQETRIFLAELGGCDTATTTPGTNIEHFASPGDTVTFDVCAESRVGALEINGYQFAVACTSTGTGGPPLTYVDDSVTTFPDGLNQPFCSTDEGVCPSVTPADFPTGRCAALSGTLTGPVKIGEIQYAVPVGALPTTPVDPYVLAIANIPESAVTRPPIGVYTLSVDGANVHIVCQTDAECPDDGVYCNGDEVCVDGVCTSVNPPCPGELCCEDTGTCATECCADAECDDGVFCNGAEVCAAGVCGPGDPVCSGELCCEDTDTCATECCSDLDCDPDGLFCNGGESCVVGICTSVGAPCAGQLCCEATDTCATECCADAECDDGVYCNGAEVCAAGVCGSGAPACLDQLCCEDRDTCATECCSDSDCGDDGLYCNGGESCVGGFCTSVGAPCPGQACCEETDTCATECCSNADCPDDGVYCNGVETCVNGTCGRTPIICPQVECGDTCNEAQGSCNSPVGTPCSDDGNQCTDDVCDGSGACTPVNSPDGTPCNDGLHCNIGETCATGACGGGGPRDCGDGIGCTDDSCNEGTDSCDNLTNDAHCDNGLWCDGPEICDPVLDCQAGTSPCDDGIDCTNDPCNEDVDTCEPKFPHHEFCDDGDLCNGSESCDILVGCQAGVDLACDDGDPCTDDSCDPIDGCVHSPAAPGTPCGDPGDSLCDHPDSCDGNGGCLSNFEVSGTACPNGLYCDGDEFCDDAGSCLPGTSPCDDGIDCTGDLCDEGTDTCTSDPLTCGNLDLTLHAQDGCFTSGQDVCVTVDVSSLDGQAMIGGQFFIEYNACLLEFMGMSPGDHPEPGVAPCITPGASPFSSEIFERVLPPAPGADPCIWRIEYAVGLPLGGQPSAADNAMATIHFLTIVPFPGDPLLAGQGDGLIGFDLGHVPATQLSDYLGGPNLPPLGNDIPVTVDDNPPVFGDNDPNFDNWCTDIGPVPNDPGDCTAVVGAIPCGVEDMTTLESPGCGLCDLSWSRSDGLPLYAPYSVGTTCITWVATDCAGNVATNDQCVTVDDMEFPTINCPPDVSVTAAAGRCDADVDPGMATCADNCACTVTCERSDGLDCHNDTYSVGTTTLTWTATDAVGNATVCLQTVTVADNEPPAVDCPPDVSVTAAAGRCDADVDPGMATCSDNCGVCLVACQRSDGLNCHNDTYPVGTTTLTWTATDSSGNTSTCGQAVTVTDNEDPTMDPLTDVTQTADAGECGAVVLKLYPNLPEKSPSVTWACVKPSV